MLWFIRSKALLKSRKTIPVSSSLFMLFNFALYLIIVKIFYLFNKVVINNKRINFKKGNFVYKL